MPDITRQDVENLRSMLIDRFIFAYNDALEEDPPCEEVDFDTMQARLKAAREAFQQIFPRLQEDTVDPQTQQAGDELYRELHLLKQYFCAPLVRPISEETLIYVSPAINCLIPLIFWDDEIALVAELLQVVLCGLELRLCQGNDPTKALKHLLKLMELGERFENSDQAADPLWDTFFEIDNLLADCLLSHTDPEAKQLCSLIYCRMAYLSKLLGAPVAVTLQPLAEGMVAAVEYLILQQEADSETALTALVAIGQLLQLRLTPQQQIIINRAYAVAEEIYES